MFAACRLQELVPAGYIPPTLYYIDPVDRTLRQEVLARFGVSLRMIEFIRMCDNSMHARIQLDDGEL